jgi:hypothetical protein
MPSGLILGGSLESVPGLDITNWLDYPEMWAVPGDARRTRALDDSPRAIIWHSTKGLPHDREDPPAQVLPGAGATHGPRQCSYEVWDHAERCPGAHAVVDHDGHVYQVADPLLDTTSWCPAWSRWAVNVALYQGRAGETHETQLAAAVLLTDLLTRHLSVQRQIPHQYLGPIPRLASAASDVVGVFGHRDASKIRGPGDPGSPLFYRLGMAGYDVVDYSLMGDRSLWVRRQRQHGIEPDDGIAGPETVAALKGAGVPHGVWVRRPGD